MCKPPSQRHHSAVSSTDPQVLGELLRPAHQAAAAAADNITQRIPRVVISPPNDEDHIDDDQTRLASYVDTVSMLPPSNISRFLLDVLDLLADTRGRPQQQQRESTVQTRLQFDRIWADRRPTGGDGIGAAQMLSEVEGIMPLPTGNADDEGAAD